MKTPFHRFGVVLACAFVAYSAAARGADLPHSPLLEPNAKVIPVLEGPAPAVKGEAATRQVLDLSQLKWTVAGFVPHLWELSWRNEGAWKMHEADVPPVPMKVPGSVQAALLAAGVISDWNQPFESRKSEWVENRHWICHAAIPDAWVKPGADVYLECLGLDYAGWVMVNNKEVGRFRGTHTPYGFHLTEVLKRQGNVIDIIFDLPPRWLGQCSMTSIITEWKARYNYTWDWVPRIVQTGIWDDIRFVVVGGPHIVDFQSAADADVKSVKGRLEMGVDLAGKPDGTVRLSLEKDGTLIRTADVPAAEAGKKIVWEDLPVELWWPNLEGSQPLYTATCSLLDSQGRVQDVAARRVGFRHVEWRTCEGAPHADPWICVVNGRPVFLQGVNFPPIRALFADVPSSEYEKRLKEFRKLGCNILRVNGCGFLEKKCFFDLCDELGLMVWQDFPLSSSGLDNWPPEDKQSIEQLSVIAKSYLQRRRNHASLIVWCGGNELQGDLNGRKCDSGKPCGLDHPLLARFAQITRQIDPQRRYLATTPSGPRAWWSWNDRGKGICWDVHGPYNKESEQYWAADNALFRSELGCPARRRSPRSRTMPAGSTPCPPPSTIRIGTGRRAGGSIGRRSPPSTAASRKTWPSTWRGARSGNPTACASARGPARIASRAAAACCSGAGTTRIRRRAIPQSLITRAIRSLRRLLCRASGERRRFTRQMPTGRT